jgi:hypothetical protein
MSYQTKLSNYSTIPIFGMNDISFTKPKKAVIE